MMHGHCGCIRLPDRTQRQSSHVCLPPWSARATGLISSYCPPNELCFRFHWPVLCRILHCGRSYRCSACRPYPLTDATDGPRNVLNPAALVLLHKMPSAVRCVRACECWCESRRRSAGWTSSPTRCRRHPDRRFPAANQDGPGEHQCKRVRAAVIRQSQDTRQRRSAHQSIRVPRSTARLLQTTTSSTDFFPDFFPQRTHR